MRSIKTKSCRRRLTTSSSPGRCFDYPSRKDPRMKYKQVTAYLGIIVLVLLSIWQLLIQLRGGQIYRYSSFDDSHDASVAERNTTTTTTASTTFMENTTDFDSMQDEEFKASAKKKKKEPAEIEFVLLTHYHKTGNALSNSLLVALDIIAEYFGMMDHISYEKLGSGQMRTHNVVNGCPDFLSSVLKNARKSTWFGNHAIGPRPRQKRSKGSRAKTRSDASNLRSLDTDIRVIYSRPTDFFCDLTEKHVFGKNTIKILHIVRDPFTMALSNYLYHRQVPTPEKWVHERFFDPCQVNSDMIKFALFGPEAPLAELMDMATIEHLVTSCRQLMTMGTDGTRYRTFGAALVSLPDADGLRLATIHQLLGSDRFAGGDMLRMANNVVRFGEWEQEQKNATTTTTTASDADRLVLTVRMDDFLKDYESSSQAAAEFIVRDLFTNATNFTNLVALEMVAALNQTKSLNSTHITQKQMGASERAELRDHLANDNLLGPILRDIQVILDNALDHS